MNRSHRTYTTVTGTDFILVLQLNRLATYYYVAYSFLIRISQCIVCIVPKSKYIKTNVITDVLSLHKNTQLGESVMRWNRGKATLSHIFTTKYRQHDRF